LVLAANEGAGGANLAVVERLLNEAGLLKRMNAPKGLFNLSDDVVNLFSDADAQRQNSDFFHPDSICFCDEIHISTCRLVGCCVRIHGDGYLWPWDVNEVRERVIRTPKLLGLQELISRRLGGTFVFPGWEERKLRERFIEGGTGWAWFIHDEF
jgi:hypothetical protein